jgi:SAM-dependent methyltransferase
MVPIPGVIHRLDREASGLLVLSLSARGYAWLKDDFKHKRVHRIYLAVVEGVVGPVGDVGTVQSFLKEARTGKVVSIPTEEYRGPVTGPSRARYKQVKRGAPRPAEDPQDAIAKLAVTHYRVLATGNNRSLLQVRLASGRKHQIRVHLASKGHPLVGDALYAPPRPDGESTLARLALHASELGLAHPGTGQSLRFVSPAPASFYRAVNAQPPSTVHDAELARKGQQSPGEHEISLDQHDPDEPREDIARWKAGAASEPDPTDQNSRVARPTPARHPHTTDAPADTSWNQVAAWYDELIEDRKSDHYTDLIVPGVLRLLAPHQGQRVLDVACGQGVIARAIAAQGASVLGIDAAPQLIEHAKARAASLASAADRLDFRVADARAVAQLPITQPIDAAVCVMALTNIEPVEPVLEGIAAHLRPGGALVFVISHPAFRSPGQTSWGWDQAQHLQYRRVDGYLSSGQHRIQMHPGDAPDIVTWTFHRPVQHYVQALARAGLLVEALEEWSSRRSSQPGPRADEENRARREIPLFMAVRAVKAQ